MLLMCSFCTPYTESKPPDLTSLPDYSVERFMNERDATVVILQPDVLQPNCSAVSVYDYDGSAVLATAAHCLPSKVDKLDPSPDAIKEANVGDRILYVTRNDWYYTGSDAMRATIKRIDPIRDRAVLSVNQFEVPIPLLKGSPCDGCPTKDYAVHSISSLSGWERRDGFISRMSFSGIGSYFMESSISIEFGWSGSPVVNEKGEVIGLMIQCSPMYDANSVRKCAPGWSLLTSVP
jgi:trypsin-like peptidase